MAQSPVFSGYTIGTLSGDTFTRGYEIAPGVRVPGSFGVTSVITYPDAGVNVGDTVTFSGVAPFGFANSATYLGYNLFDGVQYPVVSVGDTTYLLRVASGVETYQVTAAAYALAACFVRGTLIETAAGEVPVDELLDGDVIATASGRLRRIKWIGHTIVHPRRKPEPRHAHPIRIRAGAIADNVPSRDLRVSPGHALLIGDVLINAGELVNGGTIVQEEVERVDYYHVELDSHDILIADGMPCESYLDDGNRASFLNGADHIRLHGRIDRASEATCRPLVKSGPLLVAARAALLARALATGWVLAERPELRIEADGVALAPVAVVGNRYWFVVPGAGAATLRLRSTAAIVDRIAPAHADDRRLGVAIGAVRLDGRAVALTAPGFGPGFYPCESDGTSAWRWTDGDATLALAAPARVIELELRIVLPCLHRAADAAPAERTAAA